MKWFRRPKVEVLNYCNGKHDDCMWQDGHIHGIMCSKSCVGCN